MTTTLGVMADVHAGYAFKSEDFETRPCGPRLVRGASVGVGEIIDAPPYLDGSKLSPSLAQFALRAGDVVLAMDGTWTTRGVKWFQVRPSHLPALLVQRVARLRTRPGHEQSFLRCLVASPEFARHVRGVETGTTISHISATQIRAFVVHSPPLAEQRRIAGVLAALDDKIEHEALIAARVSEALSLAFRRQFSPVVVGSVPEGWSRGALGDEVEVLMGQSPPGSTYSDDQSGTPLIQGNADLGPRYPHAKRFTSRPTKMIQRDDIVFTVRAPVGEINVADRAYCAGRGVAALRCDRPVYAEQLLRALAPRWSSHERGTIFPSVNRDQIAMLPLSVPPRELSLAFDRIHRPLYDLISVTHRTQQHLAAIRDTLLPKLVSGEIRVPDSYDPDDVLGTLGDENGTSD